MLVGVSVYLYFPRTSDQELDKPREVIETIKGRVEETYTNSSRQILNRKDTHKISLPNHYFQTFNNCGPATLSMILNYYGIDVTQQVMGDILRPYQNPQGDNDDKSVTLPELAAEAERRGFVAYSRPSGDLEKLKLLISNEIPVVVKTLLEHGDDVAHYRVVTGFNDAGGFLIQDDSYQGKNKTYLYDDFLDLWRPHNYYYLVIATKEKSEVVETILGDEVDERVAWQKALEKAQEDTTTYPTSPFPVFNQAVSHYYLGNYAETVALYESVDQELPMRTLWYQLEPLRAYIELGNYDRALNIISNILNGGNRAYTELYLLRGEIYEAQGREDLAQQEYETALRYNENHAEAREKLGLQ